MECFSGIVLYFLTSCYFWSLICDNHSDLCGVRLHILFVIPPNVSVAFYVISLGPGSLIANGFYSTSSVLLVMFLSLIWHSLVLMPAPFSWYDLVIIIRGSNGCEKKDYCFFGMWSHTDWENSTSTSDGPAVSCETLVPINQIIRHHIPDDRNGRYFSQYMVWEHPFHIPFLKRPVINNAFQIFLCRVMYPYLFLINANNVSFVWQSDFISMSSMAWGNKLLCMYVYNRGRPQTALAPRPSLIYCA
jgi:hypothetical protein